MMIRTSDRIRVGARVGERVGYGGGAIIRMEWINRCVTVTVRGRWKTEAFCRRNGINTF